MDNSRYLVVDVGGTNLKYALMDRGGNLITKSKVETPKDCLASFISKIEQIGKDLKTELHGIAFSTPGCVDAETIHCPNASLPYLDAVCLAEKLKHFGLPISVENDGKAAALAELWVGNLHDVPNGAAVVLGTCVGGGLILNNHLWAGRHRLAGEVSFMPADTTDYRNEGLFGYQASAVRMIENIAKELNIKPLTDGPAVFEAIKSKEPTATKLFTDYCHQVAGLILNMQSVLDLDRYVIGGGISAQPLVTATINEQYDQILAKRDWVRLSLARPEIVASKYHNDANLYGALYHLLNKLDQTHQATL